MKSYFVVVVYNSDGSKAHESNEFVNYPEDKYIEFGLGYADNDSGYAQVEKRYKLK